MAGPKIQGRAVRLGGSKYGNMDDVPPFLLSGELFQNYFAIVKSDSPSANFQGGPVRGIWCGTPGDAILVLEDEDEDPTSENKVTVTLIAGWNPFVCVRVMSTGTSAAKMVGVY